MIDIRPNSSFGVLKGTAVVILLFLIIIAHGCSPNKPMSRADEQKQFLAPTEISKLRPEAREALRHLPGGDQAAPANAAPSASK